MTGAFALIGVLAVAVLMVLSPAAAAGSFAVATSPVGTATPGLAAPGSTAASAGSTSALPPPTSAIPASPTTASPGLQPRIVPLDLPGPHPASWGPDATPPGVPFASSGSEVVDAGSIVPANAPSFAGPCISVNLSSGDPDALPNGCVGHDEPTMSFYSDSPSSGSNVTWNVTLPEDQSATANQSDLYAAAFFGLVVSDPAAWLGECYIEVQLYPDFNWNSPSTTVSGDWAGAVVGWQVNPASGDIDTCFYSTLNVTGHPGEYFSMTQGDNLSLELLGWAKDPTGESVTLSDLTSGVSASVTLYNATGGFPLDPAFSTNAFSSALLWTTGGQLPITFGFEIGRAGHPGGVTSNPYGGCSPGLPGKPSTPCPSYDPLSWVNDTLSPWQIDVPQYFTATTHSTPVQVGFSSTVGASIYNLSNGTCLNRIGGGYCTYPWFGYDCTESAFSIGATDFPGEANDFGQWGEYPTTASQNLLGFATFAPRNFSVPSCGSTATVTVGTSGLSGGSVDFLSEIGGSYTKTGVTVGRYSIGAISPVGGGFAGWSTTGSVFVVSATSPSTTLRVTGTGTVTAMFTPTPAQTQVWFNSTTAFSSVQVTAGAYFTPSTPSTTVTPGSSISLSAGVYGVQASPAPGTLFERWSVVSGGAGAALASTNTPVSWIVVMGGASTVGVVVVYAATAAQVVVRLSGFGNGTVSLDGNPTGPYNPTTGFSTTTLEMAPGTYPAVASPSAGWTFLGWTYNVSASMVDFNASTSVSFLPGNASLTADFGADLTTLVSPGTAGQLSFNGVGPLGNDTNTSVLRGSYKIDALPFGLQRFEGWTVSNPTNLSVTSPAYPITYVQVNGPGNVTVDYATSTGLTLTIDNSPSDGGNVSFNYQLVTGASTVNTSVTTGAYLVSPLPNVGWELNTSHPWTTSGPISEVSGILTVTGTDGVLTANWVQVGYPVSFVTGSGADVSALFNGVAPAVRSGGTILLPVGRYTLEDVEGTNATFVRWVGTLNVAVGNDLLASTNVTVRGPGVLFAVASAFALGAITATPPHGEIHQSESFLAAVYGSPTNPISWHGLPTGCSSAHVNPLVCVPSQLGTSNITASILGAFGVPVVSQALAFTVGNHPEISGYTASRTTLDLGMSTTLTMTVTDGTSPIRYSYAPLPQGCVSQNSSTLACTPSGAGNVTVEVTVTDGTGAVLTSNLTLSVYPALNFVGVTALPSPVTASVPFNLTAFSSGGSPAFSYSYLGLPSSCFSSNVSKLACKPSLPGTYLVQVTLSDAAGTSLSRSVNVSVNAVPSVTVFTALPDQVTLGSAVTFNVTATGGTGALLYSYTALPGGCTATNASIVTCTPNATGQYTVTVRAADSFGVISAPASTVLVVSAASTPSGSSSSTPLWVWAIVAVVIVGIVVGLLLWRRQSTPPPPPAPLNPPADPPTTAPPTQWNEGGGT
ncbi:MAG: hypothetical protein WBF81_02310 [Thermoplasmata archaeon]